MNPCSLGSNTGIEPETDLPIGLTEAGINVISYQDGQQTPVEFSEPNYTVQQVAEPEITEQCRYYDFILRVTDHEGATAEADITFDSDGEGWAKSYSFTENSETASSVIQASDGSYFVTGSSYLETDDKLAFMVMN